MRFIDVLFFTSSFDEGFPADVIQRSEQNDERKIRTTDFFNLDQILGSLMPDGSLSAYLKYSRIWTKFPGSKHSNYRHTIKLKI